MASKKSTKETLDKMAQNQQIKDDAQDVAEKAASVTAPGPKTHLNGTMYKNRVSLPDDIKKDVVQRMQVTLASASDMYSQSKFAHWNVKGDNFYQLHLVFDHVAKVIGKQADPIAERITQLGGIANGTARQASMCSIIPEYKVDTVAGMDHVRALSDSLGKYCACLRNASDEIDDLGDEPTSDFYNQLIVDAEEQLYFLESHLEAGDVQ
jgi:starvation-inducible DNA-binding protein